MGERYSILNKTEPDLYTETSPVIIKAGQLLKDNSNDDIFAQLKILNIGSKAIKAVTVKFTFYNIKDEKISDDFEYTYLDISIKRNGIFGTQTAIKLPDNQIRKFEVIATEVVSENGDVWNNPENSIWKGVIQPPYTWQYFSDSGLPEKYRIYHSRPDFDYIATRDRDLWICSCGTINHIEDEICDNCTKALSDIENIDVEAISKVEKPSAEYYKSGNPLENILSYIKIKFSLNDELLKVSFIVIGVFLGLLILTGIISSIVPSAEEKRAELIETNFIGKTFVCEEESEESKTYKSNTITTIDFVSKSEVNTHIVMQSFSREYKYSYWKGYYYTDWEKFIDDIESTTTSEKWFVSVSKSGYVTLTVEDTIFTVTLDENDVPTELSNSTWSAPLKTTAKAEELTLAPFPEELD